MELAELRMDGSPQEWWESDESDSPGDRLYWLVGLGPRPALAARAANYNLPS
jgi:hypothetical protein